MLRKGTLLLLFGVIWNTSAHHGNECEHQGDHSHSAEQKPARLNSQPDYNPTNNYPQPAHYLTSRSVVAAAPLYYYPEFDAGQMVFLVPEAVRVERQVFGGAANIPVSGGPFPVSGGQVFGGAANIPISNGRLPIGPAVQPARPINQPFRPIGAAPIGGAASIPVSSGPFQLIRPIRDNERQQLPQIEDPNAGVRPLAQPPKLAVDPPRFPNEPRPIGGAAKIPVSAGPFPLVRPGRDGEAVRVAPEQLPQVEYPDAGFDVPKMQIKPVLLGPTPVNVPSWVTKPQVEDPNAGNAAGGEKPKTKPFPVPGTNIGQPKPVGESPKTKPFPVPGTSIGQPKPVQPVATEELVFEENKPSSPDDLDTKESALASPQRLTRPLPVPGTNIGIPRPVGSGVGSTRPFPVAGTNIGQPAPVGGPFQAVATGPFPVNVGRRSVESEPAPQVEDDVTLEVAPKKDFPKTKPFLVPGTTIGQAKPVGEGIIVRDSVADVPKTRPYPVAGTEIGQPKPVGNTEVQQNDEVPAPNTLPLTEEKAVE